jgi:hypothetical protein
MVGLEPATMEQVQHHNVVKKIVHRKNILTFQDFDMFLSGNRNKP